MSTKSTRRSFVKKSLVTPLLTAAAGSLTLTGLVNASNGSGSSSTSCTTIGSCYAGDKGSRTCNCQGGGTCACGIA